MMRNPWLAFVGLMFVASWGAAASFDGGIDPTFGSSGYSGGSGYVEARTESGFYIRPRANVFKTDQSSGTYKAFYGRIGYDAALFSIGLEGGATPKLNGYSNASASADVTFTLKSGGKGTGRLAGPNARGEVGKWGEGLTRVDVGGAVGYIAHREDGAGSVPRLILGQTDLSGFAGVKFFGLRASGQVTKSLYDKTIPTTAFAQPNTELVGVRNLISGFPDYSANARLEGSKLIFFSPFISYTHTRFKLSQASSKALQFGVGLDLVMLNVRAAYQLYDPGGGAPKRNYATVGASLNF